MRINLWDSVLLFIFLKKNTMTSYLNKSGYSSQPGILSIGEGSQNRPFGIWPFWIWDPSLWPVGQGNRSTIWKGLFSNPSPRQRPVWFFFQLLFIKKDRKWRNGKKQCKCAKDKVLSLKTIPSEMWKAPYMKPLNILCQQMCEEGVQPNDITFILSSVSL